MIRIASANESFYVDRQKVEPQVHHRGVYMCVKGICVGVGVGWVCEFGHCAEYRSQLYVHGIVSNENN